MPYKQSLEKYILLGFDTVQMTSSSKDMQLAEFIAHCSENYWSGNPYFKQLAPQLYKLMSEYIRDIK